MIDVIFNDGRYAVASKVYAYDYGQKLRIWGLQLPEIVEAHFSRCGSETAVLSTGTCEDNMSIIPVPDAMFAAPGAFRCAIFIRGDGEGERAYMMRFEVLKRPGIPTAVTEPTEQEISYFEGVLDEMREMLSQTSGAGQSGAGSITVDDAPTENSTNPVTSGAVYNALNAVESFKVTVKLEVGNNNYGEADASYSDMKAAIDAGKYVYLEARFYMNHQDEDSFSYSVNIPLSYETTKENEELIVFAHEECLDYGSSYDEVYLYSFTVEFLASNAMTVSFPEYSATLVKKSAYDTLAQRVAESFKVTVTYDLTGAQSTVTADKTFTEIKDAIDAGKFVFAAFEKVQDVGGVPTVTETQFMPLVFNWDGQYIRFGFTADGNDGYTLYAVDFWPEEEAAQYNMDAVNYGFATYQFAGKTAFESLVQRVNGLATGKVGEDCEGKQFVVNGTTKTAGVGAERFNSTEGAYQNIAIGEYSHAEGLGTQASGNYSHAEGLSTQATGSRSHAEGGSSRAIGDFSHAEGCSTQAKGNNSHAQGKYNIVDNNSKYADIIGNGANDNSRSNAQTTDWAGVLWTASDIRCGGSDMDDPNALSLSALAQRVAAIEQAIANT